MDGGDKALSQAEIDTLVTDAPDDVSADMAGETALPSPVPETSQEDVVVLAEEGGPEDEGDAASDAPTRKEKSPAPKSKKSHGSKASRSAQGAASKTKKASKTAKRATDEAATETPLAGQDLFFEGAAVFPVKERPQAGHAFEEDTEDDLFLTPAEVTTRRHIPDLLGHARSLITRGDRQPAPAEEGPGIGDLVAEVSRRLERIESVCDRLSGPPPADANSNEVLQRIERLERAINAPSNKKDHDQTDVPDPVVRLEKLEGSPVSNESLVDDVRDLKEQLAKLTSHVKAMSVRLRDTPAYGLHTHFTCRSCGASGNVAVIVKCTQCGEEGWQGWWPDD
jgi:hypothetical protein